MSIGGKLQTLIVSSGMDKKRRGSRPEPGEAPIFNGCVREEEHVKEPKAELPEVGRKPRQSVPNKQLITRDGRKNRPQGGRILGLAHRYHYINTNFSFTFELGA